MKISIIVCALLKSGFAASGQNAANIVKRQDTMNCEEKYIRFGEWRGATHTMCKYTPVTNGTVTDAEIIEIVDKHNELRRDPQTSETAMFMQKMYWDPEIAKIAQHYVNSCPAAWKRWDKQYDLDDVPGYGIPSGQNFAIDKESWDAAIQSWFDEVKYFTYDKGASLFTPADRYNQIVSDQTARLGCGFAECDGRKLYVCNYANGRRIDATGQPTNERPFINGDVCRGCPYDCDNGLCDFGGKMCYNRGYMDWTGQCICKKVYSGNSCEKFTCPSSDPDHCGTYIITKEIFAALTEAACKYNINNVPDECPLMCDLCDNFIKPPNTRLIGGSN